MNLDIAVQNCHHTSQPRLLNYRNIYNEVLYRFLIAVERHLTEIATLRCLWNLDKPAFYMYTDKRLSLRQGICLAPRATWLAIHRESLSQCRWRQHFRLGLLLPGLLSIVPGANIPEIKIRYQQLKLLDNTANINQSTYFQIFLIFICCNMIALY